MSFSNIVAEPAIIIITLFFLFFIVNVLYSYTKLETNLKSVVTFLKSLNKKEISYRFNQLDDYMSGNMYTATAWEDFKKALIFPDKVFSAAQGVNNSDYNSEIYLTVDASYFFNEESLIFSKINHKFIQIMPTLLTGLGPFFTFLNMAIAFTSVNFSADTIDSSINALINKIQMYCPLMTNIFSPNHDYLDDDLSNPQNNQLYKFSNHRNAIYFRINYDSHYRRLQEQGSNDRIFG